MHVLCNNAGVTLPGVTWEYSREEWEWVIGVNLRGVIHGISAFVPQCSRTVNEPTLSTQPRSAG